MNRNLKFIQLIEFKYCGVDMVAIFDSRAISEADVNNYLHEIFPLDHSSIIVATKDQWNHVFQYKGDFE